jgi:hypothetical protein
MLPSERYAEYREIAEEVISDLGISNKFRVQAARETQMHPNWYVNIYEGEDIFSVSGDEDLSDPDSREMIKNKIKHAIQQRLNRVD